MSYSDDIMYDDDGACLGCNCYICECEEQDKDDVLYHEYVDDHLDSLHEKE